jgi:hypothetical protein
MGRTKKTARRSTSKHRPSVAAKAARKTAPKKTSPKKKKSKSRSRSRSRSTGKRKSKSKSKSKSSKTKTLNLAGIYPPIPTPFKDNGDLNAEKLKSNIAKWSKLGFRGFVVQGSNGEYCMLSEDERVEVIRLARLAIPKH